MGLFKSYIPEEYDPNRDGSLLNFDGTRTVVPANSPAEQWLVGQSATSKDILKRDVRLALDGLAAAENPVALKQAEGFRKTLRLLE